MAIHTDSYDDSLVIDGFQNGIADNPFDGIADMRNVNVISVPGEASVLFATSQISAPPIYGTVTVTGLSSNAISFTGLPNLVNGVAIQFTNVGSLTGVALNTTYWTYASNGTYAGTLATSCKLYSDYNQSVGVTIGGTAGGATFTVYNMVGASPPVQPNYFTYDNRTGVTYMQDNSGQVWSNGELTYDGSSTHYWTFTGASGTADVNYGYGLVAYSSDTTSGGYPSNSWIFAFNTRSIDYFDTSTLTWTWGWNPATGTSHQTGYLNSFSNHEAMVAPDSKVYFCDGNWVSEFFQLDPATAFDPLTKATYTYAQNKALIPSTDKAQCFSYIGTNILIGGQNNIVYSWDGFSTGANWILLPEYNVHRMITVNTNTFIFVGNRGRIYVTNGTNAQLYKKVPDHISGTVEPYFQWGGACSVKNQLYFSALCTSNSGTSIPEYGGVWAIDMDTEAIRLTNQLSYGTYYGYASAMIPNFSSNPAGTGLYVGWDSGTTPGSFHYTIASGSTTITANANTFTPSMAGAVIYGTGIPIGAYIVSVTNSSTAILNIAATATNSNVILTILSNYGIDTSSSSPYTGSQATIDSDLIPIGTFNKPKDMTQVEYRLTKALVSGESIVIQARLLFDKTDQTTPVINTYQTILTDSTVNNYSNSAPVNFQQAQWVQFRIILNSTASSPSYVRLKNIRILGLTGQSAAQAPLLTV
jgi:hypothetical protein